MIVDTTDYGQLICGIVLGKEYGKGKAEKTLTKLKIGGIENKEVRILEVECWNTDDNLLSNKARNIEDGTFILAEIRFVKNDTKRAYAKELRMSGMINSVLTSAFETNKKTCLIGTVTKKKEYYKNDILYLLIVYVRVGERIYKLPFFNTERFKGATYATQRIYEKRKYCFYGDKVKKEDFQGQTFYTINNAYYYFEPSYRKLQEELERRKNGNKKNK